MSAQKSANASPRKSAKERKRAQKSAKERLCVKIVNNQVWNNQIWELPKNNVNKNLDKIWGKMLQNKANSTVLGAMPFHRKFTQSVNNFSGIIFHMQLQFWNFTELFVYTVTVPFSRWIIFIYRSSVYRHPPALPPAALSSLVPLFATLRHSCYHFSNLLGAQRFWVQNPWQK